MNSSSFHQSNSENINSYVDNSSISTKIRPISTGDILSGSVPLNFNNKIRHQANVGVSNVKLCMLTLFIRVFTCCYDIFRLSVMSFRLLSPARELLDLLHAHLKTKAHLLVILKLLLREEIKLESLTKRQIVVIPEMMET